MEEGGAALFKLLFHIKVTNPFTLSPKIIPVLQDSLGFSGTAVVN